MCVVSFDHLIRTGEKRGWDREAEGSGGPQVYDEIELRRLLDGQVGGLGSLQNLINVGGGAPNQIGKVCAIGHEPTGIDKLAIRVHGWQPVLSCEVYEALSLKDQNIASQNNQSTRA